MPRDNAMKAVYGVGCRDSRHPRHADAAPPRRQVYIRETMHPLCVVVGGPIAGMWQGGDTEIRVRLEIDESGLGVLVAESRARKFSYRALARKAEGAGTGSDGDVAALRCQLEAMEGGARIEIKGWAATDEIGLREIEVGTVAWADVFPVTLTRRSGD